ncbi:MAG: HAMP domain-containing sensor histidine kinase [Gallionella sp.]|nr:HAMP domain-containing sensor histidine kinase [Gallionella sp.]
MNPKNSLSEFSRNLWLTLGMFVVVAITFGFYAHLEKQVDHANELRHQSFLLADELRQSSDDLTRMVRTYVVTGDPIYKRHYQEILDIRDGKKPRPAAYDDIYWDLVLADDQRPRPGGQAVPLLELMRQAGFTEREFASLAQAKANSDVLTRPEFAAMALIESTEPTTEANRLMATRMLNDAAYHQAKYDIMRPISEFYQMVEQRTLGVVRAAENAVALARAMLIAFGLLLAFTLWHAYRVLHATLGCSVDELQGRIVRLGSGDFSSSIPVARGMENSVLDWLSATQINLAQIDAKRRQAEAALRQLNEELEEKVIARTAALEQTKLEVEQASRGKDEFLAAISHELKTPLNHILGFADLLKEGLVGELSAEQKGMAQDIFDAGSKQLAIVTSLIELARLQTGKMELQTELQEPGRMLGEIAVRHATKAQVAGLAFAVELAEGMGEMPLDREVVTHLLDQLLANAFKFTPFGGKVNLTARRVPRTDVAAPVRIEADEYLELAVTDNGPGVAPEILPRLFQPFVQGDGCLARSHQGTGAGLMIVKLLAELHGGGSGVESEPGTGAKFLVWLPCEISRPDGESAPPNII